MSTADSQEDRSAAEPSPLLRGAEVMVIPGDGRRMASRGFFSSSSWRTWFFRWMSPGSQAPVSIAIFLPMFLLTGPLRKDALFRGISLWLQTLQLLHQFAFRPARQRSAGAAFQDS